MNTITLLVVVLILLLFILALIILFYLKFKSTNVNDTVKKVIIDEFIKANCSNQESFKLSREEMAKSLRENRQELSEAIDKFRKNISDSHMSLNNLIHTRFDQFSKTQLDQLEKSNRAIVELQQKIMESLTNGLKNIQENNEKKLEQMRQTVDEKLHKTLEDRLAKSFETVTKQLIEVQKGLSEMQSLAQDVGGLKKVLSNVKNRGVLGEAQLSALLEQYLTRDQYQENVRIKPRSKEHIEFAVKLPGPEEGSVVWLPIDSKFPTEDYQRLMEAYESGDKNSIEDNARALENRIIGQAKDIRDKYIDPPHSTDFALLFLPFEGLYAEILRRPGLFEKLQREYKVTIVGPTTLTAFLNSLQVGFKTLAISKQSSEVWKVLGAVKTEFGNFGRVLTKVQDNLSDATSNLNKVSERAKQMEKKLGKVSNLPESEAREILSLENKGDNC